MTYARFFRRIAIAIAVCIVSAHHAAAQAQSYCGGVIMGDSFFSTTASNGKQTSVEYFAQLRNTTAAPVQATVQFNFNTTGHFVTGRVTGTQRFTPNGVQRISLGIETLNNPSGAGKLSEQALRNYVRVTCASIR